MPDYPDNFFFDDGNVLNLPWQKESLSQSLLVPAEITGLPRSGSGRRRLAFTSDPNILNLLTLLGGRSARLAGGIQERFNNGGCLDSGGSKREGLTSAYGAEGQGFDCVPGKTDELLNSLVSKRRRQTGIHESSQLSCSSQSSLVWFNDDTIDRNGPPYPRSTKDLRPNNRTATLKMCALFSKNFSFPHSDQRGFEGFP